MEKIKVLCIGRQLGSDGGQIGREIADMLGIPFYDKDILNRAIANTDIPPELLEKYDEKKVNTLLHTIIYQGTNKSFYGKNGSEILFELQRDLILEDASKGPGVFVGRCANAVLENAPGIETLSIFIAAPVQDRIIRVMQRDGISEKEAAAAVQNADKHRKAYYEFYADKIWGNPADYDLTVNSSAWDRKTLIDSLCRLYEGFERHKA